MAPSELADTIAIVTGGSSGIGRATCEYLVNCGARVLVTDVREREGAAFAARLGPHACFERLDVTDSAEWSRAVERCVEAFGAPNLLVANAGSMTAGRLESLTAEALATAWSVNTTSVVLGIQAVLEPMRSIGGGVVVVVSSAAGLEGSPGVGAYAASKAASISIARTAAMELGRDGIRVNVVAPGVIDTPMVRSPGVTDDDRMAWTARNPLTRMGKASEVAAAVAFLASPDCSFATGVVLPIDGGMLAGHDNSAGREL